MRNHWMKLSTGVLVNEQISHELFAISPLVMKVNHSFLCALTTGVELSFLRIRPNSHEDSLKPPHHPTVACSMWRDK